MTPGALLLELRAAGAVLRVVGGRLEAKHIPPALAPLARAHAAELRGLLAPAAPTAPVDHQVEQLPAAPPTPASSWALPPRPAGSGPLGYLDTVERDGLLVLGPIRGRATLASPSAAVDPGRAAAWFEAHDRRLAAGLDPESAERLTCTTHGPRPD